jgi:hypothetical protein
MWEEHPSYQKQQAVMIGLVVFGCIIWCAGSAMANHDWQLLRQVLLFTGALLLTLGLLSGTVWLVVRIFTRGRGRRGENKRES